MNGRIKELAFEATTERLSIDEYIEALKKEPHDFYGFRVNELEMFAELIIKECMELTHWKDFDMSVEQRIRLSVYQDIREHFGVEE